MSKNVMSEIGFVSTKTGWPLHADYCFICHASRIVAFVFGTLSSVNVVSRPRLVFAGGLAGAPIRHR
jgi:hypothetical protein